MRMSLWCVAGMALAVILMFPTPAHAQLFEDVGTRAQGMAGAFVAVADDATAGWWNPAGLATGSYFSGVVEKGRSTEPEDPTDLGPASRVNTSGFAAAFPSLGLHHYRLRIVQVDAPDPTAQASPDREALGGHARRARTLVLNQFGVTVGQSLGDHVVLATTVKLLRGGMVSTSVHSPDDPFAVSAGLAVPSKTRGDLDAGAMVTFPHVRIGLSVRNLTTPEFGEGNDRGSLTRQARAGVALFSHPGAAMSGLRVSADADLTRTASPFGEVRHVAAGTEAWLAKGRLAVRGGVAANTIGEWRPSASVGATVSVTSGVFLEAARTLGSDGSILGWSSTVRVTY